MKNIVVKILLFTEAVTVLLALTGCRDGRRNVINGMLEELDHQLSIRQSYDIPKANRMVSLHQLASTRGISDNQLYALDKTMAEEYISYNFDSTQACITRCINLAAKMQDRYKSYDSRLQLAYLYATSGHYVEAEEILGSVDTIMMGPMLMRYYLKTRQRLARELAEYSRDSMTIRKAVSDRAYYRNRLYSVLDPDSDSYICLKVEDLLEHHRLAEADSLNMYLIGRTDAKTHDYAIYTYNQAFIELDKGDSNAELIWLIRSANADIENSIKDYGSLTVLASLLFDRQDLDHAFKYINICMNDALFYNAKLRPWQIAFMLPKIEQAYQDRQEKQRQQILKYTIVLGILLLLMAVLAIVVVNRTHKLARTERQLKEMNKKVVNSNTELAGLNERLSEMNRQVTDANTIKEEYIALFINLLSDDIEKMKSYRNEVRKKIMAGNISSLKEDLSRSGAMDAEISDFYHTFDTAFLSLYPDFVVKFNELLKDEGKIILKKGELLNTELRIFALIRLGITDSSKIAVLLRYSVNTIYNYRAKVKNCAIDSREDFEEAVKRIESFK